MTGNSPPPGWYDDGEGIQRWWDGERWVDNLPQSPDGTAEHSRTITTEGPTRSSRGRVFIGLGALVAIAALVAVALVVSGSLDEQAPSDATSAEAPAEPEPLVFSSIEEMREQYLTIGSECDPVDDSPAPIFAQVHIVTCDGAEVGLIHVKSGNTGEVKALAELRVQVSNGSVINAPDWTWAVTIHPTLDPALAQEIRERFVP